MSGVLVRAEYWLECSTSSIGLQVIGTATSQIKIRYVDTSSALMQTRTRALPTVSQRLTKLSCGVSRVSAT
jgi:hypothetical protein